MILGGTGQLRLFYVVFHGSLAQIKHSVGDFRRFGSISVVLVGSFSSVSEKCF